MNLEFLRNHKIPVETLEKICELQDIWPRFNRVPLTPDDISRWAVGMGFKPVPCKHVVRATTRIISGSRFFLYNPDLPEGELLHTMSHELCHRVTNNTADEIIAHIFAHLCRIPQTAMFRLEKKFRWLTPKLVFEHFSPWKMATPQRDIEICDQRLEIFAALYQFPT